MECFQNEPKEILNTFLAYTEGQKKAYIDWIYEAKTDKTKAKRILQMMDSVSKGLKFGDT